LDLAIAFAVCVEGFSTKVKTPNRAPNLGNVPRKLKRVIRNAADASAVEKLLTPEIDSFLKLEAQGEVYATLMKTIKKKSKEVNYSLGADFGIKAPIILPSLVDTAIAAGTFSKLVAAVTAAGLVGTLSGEDRFTVLAPTDEAFDKLPEGALDALLADPEKLKGVLTYHVIPGTVKSQKVIALGGQKVTTVNGQEVAVKVDKKSGSVEIGGAKITKTDIKCANGIIHVIDTVLMPKE
jgi:hypothetical protein